MSNWVFINSVNEEIYSTFFLCSYGGHKSLCMIKSVVVGFLQIPNCNLLCVFVLDISKNQIFYQIPLLL
jgi:hypothetical protein